MSSFLEKFFLHCVGADEECAIQSPKSERVKLISMGKAILITTFFSSFSFFYAVYLISNSITVAFFLCLVWGAFIFNIDKYLISSMMGVSDKFQELLLFIPRFIIALFISLTIAVPIELLIFKDEISQFIYKNEVDEIQYQINNLEKERGNKKKILLKENFNLHERIGSLSSAISNCEEKVSKLRDSYICESDGTCGSGKVGFGKTTEVKYTLYSEVKKSCSITAKNNLKIISSLDKYLSLNKKIIEDEDRYYNSQKDRITKEVQSNMSDSLLSRISALQKMSSSDATIRNVIYMIMLLILAMELMPLLIKVLSRRGIYEDIIEEKNYSILYTVKHNIKENIIKHRQEKKVEDINIFEKAHPNQTKREG